MKSIWTRVMVIGALCGVVFPACGDDDDAATSDPEAYCAAIDDLGDRLPTDEEISMILDVAPEEIAEDLDVVLGALREDGAAAFEDPEVAARFGPIEEFEAANCGSDDDTDDDSQTGDDQGSAPAGDAAAYCAVIDELGDRLPTDEEISMILEVAPEEIAAELDVVLDAVRKNGEAAFEDPGAVAAFGPIEQFEAANCGSGDDNADGTSDEIDPDAQRVDVVATEYAYEFSPPEAGAVSFVMSNEGSEIHEMLLARFVGDATIEDAFASEDPEADGLVETVGFEGPVTPGADGVLTVESLDQGRYVLACLIPSGDGESHGEKGMVSEFTIG